jgi:hypothetical protein
MVKDMSIFSKKLKLVSTQKIWGLSQHNAMTDLIRYRNNWYCTFRESDKHVYGTCGTIRLLGSSDGNVWYSKAEFKEDGIDLRDPKLSITPDGRLMLLVGGTIYDDQRKYISRQPRVAFSNDGISWSPFSLILEPHEWLWRVTWHKGKAYGASYRLSDITNVKKEWMINLFESPDGLNYNHITQWNIPGYPSEATIRFHSSDEMIALVRREMKHHNEAWIGLSLPPYRVWNWNEARYHLGGPNFLVFDNEEMLAAGRIIMSNPYGFFEKTAILCMSSKELLPELLLPSGGDTSYPGMAVHEEQLWVSYYSTHEANTAVYLSRIDIIED